MPQPIDPRIDEVFQLVRREIWIITAAAGNDRGGCVATFVGRASIDSARPVMTAAIAVNHYTYELIERSGAFAAHLVGRDEIDLAWRFGLGSGRDHDKFEKLVWHTAETGSPILDASLAWLDCRVFDQHAGGDRTYFWADIVAGERRGEDAPLSDEDLFRLATPEQMRGLKESLVSDVAIQRPLYEEWRAALPPSPAGRGSG